ncbi:MAG: hypothetical protein ACYTBV_17895 [Planctomycetota bacterium]|jgi:hypothetical protein
MYEQTNMILCEDMVVAESALLKREHSNKYGGVEGLADNELANPDELERQVYREELAPILALPIQGNRCSLRPAIDEDGSVCWGAFGTIDFERMYPFNKTIYKADKLCEQLKNVLIMFSIVNERLKPRAKYTVLKYLKMGIIELEHIVDNDMRALGRLYLRVRRMRKEIAELREVGWRRHHQQRAEAFWRSL